jgi:hypothetical protein
MAAPFENSAFAGLSSRFERAVAELRSRFRTAWIGDAEYRAALGHNPTPVCFVFKERFSGKKVRLWRDDLAKLRGKGPPIDIGPDDLFAGYFTSAELGVFLELDWPMPKNILDLYVEFRCQTNGLHLPAGRSLLGALTCFGLDHMTRNRKDAMRNLIMKAPDLEPHRADILEYCEDDVDGEDALLGAELPSIDWPYALLRGRYMAAVAKMERRGVPIDVRAWRQLCERWEPLKLMMVRDVDQRFGVYDGTTFKEHAFVAEMNRRGIDWPILPSGHPNLEATAFRNMADFYPALRPLHELRESLAKMRLTGLTVGPDGRNRCLLSPYGTKTSRNSTSNSKFIFGSSRWMRGLMRPPPGHALAYVDWSGQEIAVAAALYGDERLAESYRSGDPHLYFAKANRLVPPDATKKSHPEIREACKTVNLGTLYGLTWTGLSTRLQIAPAGARRLLRLHHETFPTYWREIDQMVSSAMLSNHMESTFGWKYHVTAGVNPRSLQNWQAQTNAAEMMRLAAIAATEMNLSVCCPVHDAFLLCAPIERIEEEVALMRECMRRAGLVITAGIVEVDTGEPEIIRAPDRYMDERGAEMWARVRAMARSLPVPVKEEGIPLPEIETQWPDPLAGET